MEVETRNRNTMVQSKSVWLGPVSGLFPVHATGPLNTSLVAKELITSKYLLLHAELLLLEKPFTVPRQFIA